MTYEYFKENYGKLTKEEIAFFDKFRLQLRAEELEELYEESRQHSAKLLKDFKKKMASLNKDNPG